MEAAQIVALILGNAFALARQIGGPKLTREAAKAELEALAAEPPQGPTSTASGQHAAFEQGRRERNGSSE